MPGLSKLALIAYYPEPGEDTCQSQLHAAALKMQTLLLMSHADCLSLAGKADPFASGLRRRGEELEHEVLLAQDIPHENLWTIVSERPKGAPRLR